MTADKVSAWVGIWLGACAAKRWLFRTAQVARTWWQTIGSWTLLFVVAALGLRLAKDVRGALLWLLVALFCLWAVKSNRAQRRRHA